MRYRIDPRWRVESWSPLLTTTNGTPSPGVISTRAILPFKSTSGRLPQHDPAPGAWPSKVRPAARAKLTITRMGFMALHLQRSAAHGKYRFRCHDSIEHKAVARDTPRNS